nr:hypothetical protein 8 [Pseudomonadaceae bacterium]
MAMETKLRKLSDIHPYPGNPRCNDGAVEAVVASIREFGFRQPIVIDAEGIIVCGHTRYKAAQKLGLDTVPVHVATDLTPEQLKAYRLADNKTAELSEWNLDLLPTELAELRAADFDLEPIGFSEDELAKLLAEDITAGLTDPDEVPEPPDEATTKPGDLWLLGEHRLLCGDSADPKDVGRLLDGADVHLVNTDPPYNVKVEPRSNNAIAAGLSSFQGTKHHQKFDLERHPEKSTPTQKKMRAKDRPLENDFVSEETFDGLLADWFGNIARVLLPGRAFYIWGGYANLGNYPPVLKSSGLYFSQGIVWDKQHPVLTRKDFMGAFEICFYGWREGSGHKFFGPANATDLWHVKKVNPNKMIHLCLHPDALVMTEFGFRPISSISAGNRVYGADGRFHAVTHVSSHTYQSPELVRIVAKGGNIPTTASDNHPFLIWRPTRKGRRVVGGSVLWLRADEIRAGDYTMTPLPDEAEEDPAPHRDEEFWFLFGLYLAQGSLQRAGHGENRYPSFHLHKRRQDLIGRIHDRWDSVGEYDPNDYGERAQGVTVMAFDPEAGAAFEQLGGRRSHAKRLAPVIFNLPRPKRLAVFQGWLNGDGCRVHDRAYWQGNTCSPDLAAQLAMLGESVGYKSNLFRYEPPVELGMINGRRIQSARPVYNLYFYARDPKRRRGTILYLEHAGREYSLRYVKSVERIPYQGEVWNLTVEDNHTFQTAVGMSHNTEKPTELAVRAMQYSSRPGENVLDLFGGSGSTLIAAEQTGRSAFLMELDPLYADVIVERWQTFTGRQAERRDSQNRCVPSPPVCPDMPESSDRHVVR